MVKNLNYQGFLKLDQNEDSDQENAKTYGRNDLQLEETVNVMKDLIFMVKFSPLQNEEVSRAQGE